MATTRATGFNILHGHPDWPLKLPVQRSKIVAINHVSCANARVPSEMPIKRMVNPMNRIAPVIRWCLSLLVVCLTTVAAAETGVVIYDFSEQHTQTMHAGKMQLQGEHGFTHANDEQPARIWYEATPNTRDICTWHVKDLNIIGQDALQLHAKWPASTRLTIDLWYDGKMVDPRLFSYIPGTDQWQALEIPVLGGKLSITFSLSENTPQAAESGQELRELFLQKLVGISRPIEQPHQLPEADEIIIVPEPKSVEIESNHALTLVKNGLANFRVGVDGTTTEQFRALIEREMFASLQALSSQPMPSQAVADEKQHAAKNVVDIILDLGGQGTAAQALSVDIPDVAEGYSLVSGTVGQRDAIVIAARERAGLYWGFQTLRQLLRKDSDGGLSVDACRIRDWPDLPYRSMGAAGVPTILAGNHHYKANVNYIPAWELGGRWHDLATQDRERLAHAIAYAQARGTDINHWVEALDRPTQNFITVSNHDDVEAYYQTLKLGLDAGCKTITIGFDDQARADEAFVEADRAVFTDDLEAHAHLTAIIAKRILADYPGTKIFVITKNYQSVGATDIDGYFERAGVPAEVMPMWTGESTVTLSYPQDKIDSYLNGIDGRDFVIFDNTVSQPYGQARAGFRLMETFADGYKTLLETPQLYGFHAMGYITDRRGPMMLVRNLTVADFLWNAKQYDPTRSRNRILAKLYGPENVGHLLRFRYQMLTVASIFPVEKNPTQVTDERLAAYPMTQESYARFQNAVDQSRAILNQIETTTTHEALTTALIAELTEMCDRAQTLIDRSWQLNQNRELKTFDARSAPTVLDIHTDWQGGQLHPQYAWQCPPRDSLAIYGTKLDINHMRVDFIIHDVPDRAITLRLTGQDDDKPGATPVTIEMNGHTVFHGDNTFVEKGWSEVSYTIQPQWLTQGVNRLDIRNMEESDAFSADWFMVAGASLHGEQE